MSENIGSKLKTLRKSKKLTQQDVADKLDISRATLSNYEIGRRTPNLKDLQRISEFFGVGLDYFGVATADEVLELVARAKDVFASDEISTERKEELFREFICG